MEQTVLPIHFEDRSGNEFERLAFAYVARCKEWEKIEWLGQTGSDGGRDIWGEIDGDSYCYQCANYKSLVYKKASDDIDKLIAGGTIPKHFTIICGGRVSGDMRQSITTYAVAKGITSCEVWSGVEFEEKLRRDTPELIKRFIKGEAFPDTPSELIKLALDTKGATDEDIINLLAECLDRPAFTTPFYRESNIPNFEKAVGDAIEVLNTGIHRSRDGAVIRQIPSRHRIKDAKLKQALAQITESIVKLRDDFYELKRNKEIQPCGCGNEDCPTFMLSDKACKLMDDSRRDVFKKFAEIKPDFNLRLY
ncbi:MAG: hypothetical protein JST90_00920 [Bacteroidetes bacterium]|nr:hypothetical protein [Bacteroidota bacterium]